MVLEVNLETDTPLHSIPLPSPLFTGRKIYLDKLRQYFNFEHGQRVQRKQFLLYGLGGIGKTQICMKFAEESADR
jgi:hypothetical protein